ncbi:FCR3 [Candida jiufengensis]|uniref:FCR3 n=1 Tax=Candida jiufengensis TaxID=497108 RepID=UPI0022253B04|nr:FCR3 [Candida jiufengensis]KAI5956544.1 FCR3 [Candida jiufengensis]
MTFPQSTPNYWQGYQSPSLSVNNNPKHDLYNDICELNQENVTLFNDQQLQQQQQNDQTFQYNSNPNIYSNPNHFQYDTNNINEENFNFLDQQRQVQLQQEINNNNNNDNNGNVRSHPLSQQHINGIGSITSNGSSPSQGHIVNNYVSPETSGTSETSVNDMDAMKLESNLNNTYNPSSRKLSTKSKKQLLDEQDAILIARDDSELTEDELQLKRKAQNRAAQRAFRERKETKLKELENKLLQSEEERQRLIDQLDIIRKQNISISSENDFLRNNDGSNFLPNSNLNTVNKFDFPQSQEEFIDHVMKGTGHDIDQSKVNTVYNKEGKKLLALGAVWDYLQIKAEEANLDSNSIDFVEVMNKLKGNEKCHGYGPAYPLDLVNKVIESCIE